MESSVQPPNNQQNEANKVSDQLQSQNMAKPGNSSEELEEASPEELQLIEERNELRKLAADLLQENRSLSLERDLEEEDFIKSENDSEKTIEAMHERLLDVRNLCNKRKKIYERFFIFADRKLQELKFVDNRSEPLLRQKLLAIEKMFPTFEEQQKTIKELTANYENLCGDDFDGFDLVMSECNKIEETCYKLASIILE